MNQRRNEIKTKNINAKLALRGSAVVCVCGAECDGLVVVDALPAVSQIE